MASRSGMRLDWSRRGPLLFQYKVMARSSSGQTAASGRLTGGISGTPHIIDCALMALEAWLLELSEGTDDIEPSLFRILMESNSVMTTAVVASVCNAYPEQCGAAALALLTSREAIEMDRARLAREQSSVAAMDFPSSDPMQKFYNDERKRSSVLVHRYSRSGGIGMEVAVWRESRTGLADYRRSPRRDSGRR